jgi:hypothetical protein
MRRTFACCPREGVAAEPDAAAGIERDEWLLPGKFPLRQSSELGVDDREQIVARLQVSLLRTFE